MQVVSREIDLPVLWAVVYRRRFGDRARRGLTANERR